MEKVAYRARRPHYLAHIQPVWEALPDDVKWEGGWPQHGGPTIIVAGSSDIVNGRPYIWIEHGSGQSYTGIDATVSRGYSGGHLHDACKLFICPNKEVAARWQDRYPDKPTAVVGSPRLDQYHANPSNPGKVVAFTFHWDCKVAPETRTAWPHFQAQIYTVVQHFRNQGWEVIGHAHPRIRQAIEPEWKRLSVRWTDDPLVEASVLVADNTSLIADFLSLGRPVVALNAPWYRRHVHHGHRFWTLDVTYADSPWELFNIELDQLPKPARQPYAFTDGRASERAALAITDYLRSWGSPQ